ncbi:F-box SKIP23-like protein (DUF295) [Rhynchospora pubera]|uniref:F-box SKIP23-like protein (DUF295) n=1 Tax=Rhynchospora pubera TaxID=906938 RepID=A0AAV8F7S4_9POAL|nr:F-box SKIP23-like protein (DUF295) [Rhynchospora pubera]
MDWAGLLPEVLGAILEKLIESTDHLRFRCVCHSWRSFARSHPVPSPLPWLHLPHNPNTTDLRFYSLSEDRVYKIPFPEIYNSRVIGSTSGFLLVVPNSSSDPQVMIINPFTGTRVHLPNIYRPGPRIYPDIVWDYSGSVVVGNLECPQVVAYCRPGDHSWTRIGNLTSDTIYKIVYKAGSFYLFECVSAKIYVLDGETLKLTRIIELPHHGFKFSVFIVSPDDILLCTDLCFNENTRWVSVLLNQNFLDESSWSNVTDIGNYALFGAYRYTLDCHSSCYVLSEANRHTGLRNNLIQYEFFSNKYTDIHTRTCYIYARKLRNLTCKVKGQCSCSSNPSWILPSFDNTLQ